MIAATPATRVFLFEAAVDMRKGFEGLSALARDKLGEDPTSGHLFVFSNAARNRLKILFWDGSGLWVCGKRLERGRFCWPSSEDARSAGGKLRISAGELSMLLDGLDFGRAQKRRWWRKSGG
jgi:transposase